MKQETLEEAVKKYSKDEYSTPIPLAMCMDFARFGAKWQQEQDKKLYSEEDVLEIIRQYALEEHLITSSKPDIWFETFKKK